PAHTSGTALATDTTSAPSNSKPGLLASDHLTVVAETGEWDGDEPVMLTVRVETVLGQPGSTRVSLVNDSPREIASGVDAGDTVGIPDREGDAWFNVDPLTADALMAAANDKKPVPIPVVVNATVMLEGDFSNGALLGSMGQQVADHVQRSLGAELENTRIIIDDAGKPSGYSDALTRISTAATPDSTTIAKLVATKVVDWSASISDPDDPVGMSLTALVPVDQSVTDLMDVFGGAHALGLDSQYQHVSIHKVRTAPFDTDVEVRTGFPVPPSALGGKVSQWVTTYKGDYLYDDPAEYRVTTQAWPSITW
ncbi:MAG: hypothetical protein QG597_1418, partial [Actinomycetota bacterium]|nr:hypothetical protein [Actinomycetota bacterium]